MVGNTPIENKDPLDHVVDMFQCSICGRELASRDNLRRHLRDVHFKCTIRACNVLSGGKAELLRHMEAVHGIKLKVRKTRLVESALKRNTVFIPSNDSRSPEVVGNAPIENKDPLDHVADSEDVYILGSKGDKATKEMVAPPVGDIEDLTLAAGRGMLEGVQV